ncbi:hypothetical protein [Xanthomonas sp. WCS2018Cala2-21]|uniref:hypothetical protein n=1 Tax=Xanthomonas sp. WCS2018Cala2-21 TaxID=3073644 RepID=UPI00387E86EA
MLDLMGIAAEPFRDVMGEQATFVSQARNALVGFALHLFESRYEKLSLGFHARAGAPTLCMSYRLSSGDVLTSRHN